MSLDVHVGPLTRCYAGAWEGMDDRVRADVLAWRDRLHRSLGRTLPEPLDWDETVEAPHFTGRPGWIGFGALVLWAAYAEHPSLSRPDVLPQEWDDDPALILSNAEGFRSRYSHLVRNVELWLPLPFDFTFEGEDVEGRRIVFGSVMMLGDQLGALNDATWKMTEEEAATWSRHAPQDDETLEVNARYAFAVLSGLARRAAAHRLPMTLDT
jgi:hypothetical protein